MREPSEIVKSLKLEVTPYQHQVEEWLVSSNEPNRMLLWEMGTGKTLAAICWLRLKYRQRGFVGPTLILAPLATLGGWLREFQRSAPPAVRDAVVVAAEIGGKKLNGAARAKLIADPKNRIIITNHDSLQLPLVLAACQKKGFVDIVVDEVHRFKNPKAKRFKSLLTFSDGATNRLALTGTLVLNGYMDVWAPARFTDKGKTFGTNFYSQFRNLYFRDANAGRFVSYPNWQPLPGADAVIGTKLRDISSVKRKLDCLDLPPRVVVEVPVELSHAQRVLYDQMEKELVAMASDTEVATADNALVKLLRIRQILAGFVSLEKDLEDPLQNRTHVIEENPRLDALRALLEDLPPTAKVVVWSTFRANYQRLRELVDDTLGYAGGYAELTGDTKDRDAEIERFQRDATCRVFLSNPQAGGTGVDGLQRVASYCIYFDRSHNAEHYWQSRDRIHRAGAEAHEKITEIHLVAKGTLDEEILAALSRKENFAENILSRVRSKACQPKGTKPAR